MATQTVRFRELAPLRRAAVRALHELNPWWNLKIVLFIATWAAVAVVALTVPLVPVRLLCYVLAGASLQGLGILMHEAVHGVLFRHRGLNRWLGFVCGLPAFLSVTAYRVGHLRHHRYERSARDPDELENFSSRPRVLALLFCAVFLGGDLFGFFTVGPVNAWRTRGRERRQIVVEYGLIVAAFAAAFALVPFPVLLHVWIFPALVARQLTNVRTLAEHALTAHGDRIAATRTVLSNRFVSFFMCNVNYHIGHHLFPAVPWYNLRRLHALLAPDFRRAGAQIYPSYTRFLLDLVRVVLGAWAPGGGRMALRLPPVVA